jgi:hypothetical protein
LLVAVAVALALAGCSTADPTESPAVTDPTAASPSTSTAASRTPTTSVAPDVSLSPSSTAVAPGTLDQTKLAAAITGTLRTRLGEDVQIAVSCPAGVALAAGAVSRCGSTVDGQLLVYTVTQTNAKGDVDFAPTSAVIDIEALEEQTSGQFATQVGGSWVADCDTGPRDLAFLVRGVGSLIGCTFTGADGGTTAYTVTVTDLDGTVAWLAD